MTLLTSYLKSVLCVVSIIEGIIIQYREVIVLKLFYCYFCKYVMTELAIIYTVCLVNN